MDARAAWRAQWVGQWAQRPLCPLCGVRPTMPMGEHQKRAACIVAGTAQAMHARGWLAARSRSGIIRSTPAVPQEVAPSYVMDQKACDGLWAPAWAVRVARLGVSADRRKRWLGKLALVPGDDHEALLDGAARLGGDEAVVALLDGMFPRTARARVFAAAAYLGGEPAVAALYTEDADGQGEHAEGHG